MGSSSTAAHSPRQLRVIISASLWTVSACSKLLLGCFITCLLAGLEYLHDQGIVHRDLKPENLVLDAHFQLKIVDFGLAARTHEIDRMPDARQPQPRVLHSGVGSLPYSAPEVCRFVVALRLAADTLAQVYYSKELYQSRGYNGAAADVWSCAVILFVMLTGSRTH